MNESSDPVKDSDKPRYDDWAPPPPLPKPRSGKSQNGSQSRSRSRSHRSRGSIYWKTRIPALILFVMSLLWFLLHLSLASIHLINAYALSKNKPPIVPMVQPRHESDIATYTQIVITVSALAANLVMVIGSYNMMKFRELRSARLAMIVACVPCFGFLWIATIPIGIWGLIVLSDDWVKDAFH